jgi:hypothetical protein
MSVDITLIDVVGFNEQKAWADGSGWGEARHYR